MTFNKKRSILVGLLIILFAVGFYYMPTIVKAQQFSEAMDMKNIEHTFISMDEFLPSKTLNKSEDPFVFPRVPNVSLPSQFTLDETTFSTINFLDSSYTQGLIVIKNDTIEFEEYYRGQHEESNHISWSMAKSYISSLFGIALEDGHIGSVEDKVETYLPQFVGTGYEGVKIKDVLQMSTGVKFDETYSDPKSDISRYWTGFMTGKSQDKFAETLVREREPGTYNHYVSILSLIHI